MDVNRVTSQQTSLDSLNENNKKDKNTIDKDFFLKMLVAQLKHQDPLSPVDNNEYMNQSVQFSTLEAIQALNDNLTLNLNQTKAYSFLGNTVGTNALNTDTNEVEYIEGKVDSISYSNGQVYIHIGKHIAKPENVLAVTTTTSSEESDENEPSTPPATSEE
ncbi:hypothetical protein IMX26_00455 [Clostridium sp. 'deep sea']|uniref:flagellar hook capping FlgD N-terminal domain-containing protein n=1 Tax=Clostridium sp. 'deep sea' TaxID=2779445 RepID=UPI001896977C|nr:flagellar hook capping FlgD N-terminal domain-containing protein [Clostridium sp. 'deep sea']QOR35347.1 hypothetical protein IMX26_00455 [Clostridium sp. 'deep sea']